MTDTFDRLSAALSNRYHLHRELGQGGMATVYLAEDLKHHRQVAIKVLRPELSATLGPERFAREIEVAARLQHPHILGVLDSGDADGFFYYVMPYVEGETLRERLTRGGELPVPEAVRLLGEIAEALAVAHKAGVVHRDIKPENILLSGRHALIMDFGVAKAVTEASGRQQLTTAGVALGTPAYMAPEQASADPQMDGRVDIYALGVLGYEMLTGHTPFPGLTPQQTLAAHLTQAPTPLGQQRAGLSQALDEVVMKCLAKRPADRFQHADELVALLEPLGTSSGGMTPAQTQPVQAMTGRKPSRWIVAASLMGVLMVAVAIALLRRDEHRPVALRDRTQLTSTGRVRLPSISPDGKQLAYVVTNCTRGECRFGIEVQDVTTGASRRVLDGATAAYRINWSPDQRNLLFQGTVDGRFGMHLVSLLGGAPHWITSGSAAFWAGGDSLIYAQQPGRDAIGSISVSGLDGVARDSIPVAGVSTFLGLADNYSPFGWIIAGLQSAGETEFRAMDRAGRASPGALPHIFGAKRWVLVADAFWIGLGPTTPTVELSTIIRIPFDSRTGRFAQAWDTVYSGRSTSFGVTADGGTLVLDEGASEFSGWALELRDALTGTFPEERLLLRSTSPIGVLLSREGTQVVLRRTGVSSARGEHLSVVPYGGGPEESLSLSASVLGWGWGLDSASVAVWETIPAGVRFSLVDLRSGLADGVFLAPDAAVFDVTALRGGGWAWIVVRDRHLRIQQPADSAPREFPIPDWYQSFDGLIQGSGNGRVAFTGWNAPRMDSAMLSVMSLPDGKVTPWVTVFSEGTAGWWLSDGTILFANWDTPESVSLYRARGPGKMERLGTIPRQVPMSIFNFSVSEDLRRATVVTRDYHGDAWMSSVVRP